MSLRTTHQLACLPAEQSAPPALLAPAFFSSQMLISTYRMYASFRFSKIKTTGAQYA